MVEMLGVLAIIGVLSVGAIAGYQKAMFKYKLNKQAVQISTLIGSILPYGLNLGFANATDSSYEKVSLIPMLRKLDIIPTEMLQSHDNHILDSLGNEIVIQAAREDTLNYYQMFFKLTPSDLNRESCRNIMNVLKEFSNVLTHVSISTHQNDTLNNIVRYLGDNDCRNGSLCLRNMTVSDMDEFCSICNDSKLTCLFGALWK